MNRACTSPGVLYRSPGEEYRYVGPYTKWQERLSQPFELDPSLGTNIRVSCGQCLNCRIKRAQEWKIRGVHEMQSTFDPTWAVTLTVSDNNMPPSGTLDRPTLQNFHKRLRKACGPFRMLYCGEYGPNTGRAHYHAVYFGLNLPDAYKGTHWGSRTLLETWGQGMVQFHLATDKSIAYVSGYVVSKLRNQFRVPPVMETVDPNTGEILAEEGVAPEFLGVSTGGRGDLRGLGFTWADKYGDQVLDQGHIILNGKECHTVPRYYQKIWRQQNRPGLSAFLQKRLEKAQEVRELDYEDLHILNRAVKISLADNARNTL
ncbi:MAG: replication initiator protein [Microvirus sp.]|nr:MAG: replication initiator protein [Microvirus sp.]